MPEIPTATYCYTDGQSHRLSLRVATDAPGHAYVWLDAENLAFGGETASVWLTTIEAAELLAALDGGREFRRGDRLVVRPGDVWTSVTVSRLPDDDEAAATVPVVMLTARLPELSRALAGAIRDAERRATGRGQRPRVLTLAEHDRAWHAVEGAAGEPGADPDTILNAVLAVLGIKTPEATTE
ncbi:hypothetical protein ACIQU7_24035 [Streptomyces albidoflavus]